MRSSSLSVLALSLVLPGLSPAFAQSDAETLLAPVVLSGGLTPVRAADYGRAFSVITAEDIEKRGITTVQDALRALPGVAVNGSGRDMGQVRIRGGEGNHTRVLIDGVPVAGGGTEYMFAGLETENIERIEVLRGPQSAFYGSNASSGVVNIITKKATGTGSGAKLEVGNGHIASAFTQMRGTAGGLRLALHDSHDRSFDLSGKGGEKDGIRRRSAQLSGDWQAGERLSFTFQLREARDKFETDPQDYGASDLRDSLVDLAGYAGERRESAQSLSARYETASGRIAHHLSLENVISRSRYAGTDTFSRAQSRVLKYRAEIGLDGAADSADHVLNLLADRRLEQYADDYQPNIKRRQSSLGFEYRGRAFEDLAIQAGVRRDFNTDFGDYTTWNAALSWHLNDSLRIHASGGRASVNPSYGQLYAIQNGWTGNAGLKPERNSGYDLGLAFTTPDGALSGDLTWFKETLTGKIQAQGGTYINSPQKADRQGIELEAHFALSDQLSFGGSYTYTHAYDRAGVVEIRRPRNELGLTAAWTSQDQKLGLSADLRHVRGNFDKKWLNNDWSPAPTEMPAFTVVNLAANYEVSSQISLSARLLNVFDTDYQEVWGYGTQDRTLWLGLSAKF